MSTVSHRPPLSAARVIRGLAIALLALAFVALAEASPGQQLTATLTVTGSPQHTIRTRNGGAEWFMSGFTVKETAKILGGGKYGVAFKTDPSNFGWRWDTQVHEPSHKTYGWFSRNPAYPASFPETLDQELQAAEDAGWLSVLTLPVPKVMLSSTTGGPVGEGYAWQTDTFYAALVQYVLGTADGDYAARVAALPTLDSNDPRTAGFNWANLRAARGRVQPYDVWGFAIGTEPYWAEDLSAAEYAARYISRAQAIRAKVPTAKLGLFLLQNAKWERAVMTAVPHSLVDWLALRDNYHGFGNGREQNVSYWLGAFNGREKVIGSVGNQGWNPDGTKHMWDGYAVPPTTNFYAVQARQAIDKFYPTRQDLKDKLVWTEWGYQVVSPAGEFNELGQGIMRAGQYADGFKDDVMLNATFTVNNEPPYNFGAVARRKDSLSFELTPTYYVLEMLASLLGSRYVPSTTTGPTYEVDPPNGWPALVINYVDTWVFARGTDRYLFVINRHPSAPVELQLGNLDGYAPVEWQQLGGTGFTWESDNRANAQNVVTRDRPPGPLVFEPMSVSLVRLAQGALPPDGGGPIWGDVSGDGVVNSTDALGTLSHTVGMPRAGYDYTVADVNADGSITTLDALVDLYYSVGLDVSGYRVGQPVGGGNGDLVAAPQLARAPVPTDGRVYVGLRQPERSGRREENGGTGELRLVVRAARYLVEDEIGSFHLRLRWDPSRLRFRSAGAAGDESQLLLGVNDGEAETGSLVVAGATASAFGEQLLEVVFERVQASVGEDAVSLEVLGLGAARSGQDLTPHVEVRTERIDPEGESGGGGGAAEGLGLPYPNPAPGRVSIPLRVDALGAASLASEPPSGVELTVFDVRGRTVRRLLRDEPVSGQRVVEWDGTDESGRRVPAGIYVLQLRSGGERETRKVVLY